MKIDVTLLKNRENFQGPIILSTETIRVPQDIKILNMETVEEIMEERVERRRKLIEYWMSKPENQLISNPVFDDHSDRYPIAWSPIITVDALEFICQRI